MIKIFMVLSLVATIICGAATAKSYKTSYVVINDSQKALKNKVVRLSVDQPWALSVTVSEGKTEIPSQMDDTNGDGTPDQIVVIADFAASERKQFDLLFSDREQNPDRYPSRVQAQVFGKQGQEYSLRQWRPDTSHSAADSASLLRLFTDLAAGELMGWDAINEATIKLESPDGSHARIVSQGPLRAIAQVETNGWSYRGIPLDIRSRYTIYGGHNEIAVEHRISGDFESARFCTGVGKSDKSMADDNGRAAAWGINDNGGATGVAIEREYIIQRHDNALSHLFQLMPDKNGVIRYTITSSADSSQHPASESFFEYVQTMRSCEDVAPLKIYEGQIKKVGMIGERVEKLIVK